MTPTAPTGRSSVTVQRGGYVIAVVINAAVLYVLNVQPGWQALPFVTDSASEVLGLVNLSLAAGLVANVAYLAHHTQWLKSLGDLVMAGIGLAVAVRLWQVFPFALNSSSFDWALLVRILLIIAIVGTSIAIVAQLISLVRLAARPRTPGGQASVRH